MPRARSERAHELVLGAAQKLFVERGIDATSMDAVASFSGVSKATIYKHWPDKDALCLEVLGRLNVLPEFDSGDIRRDITDLLSYEPPHQTAAVQASIMTHFGAYAAHNPAFAKAWRRRVLEPPRTQLAALLRRAVADGLIRPGINIEVAVAQLIGPMIYRKVTGILDIPLPADMSNQIVASFWKGYAGEPTRAVPSGKTRSARRASQV